MLSPDGSYIQTDYLPDLSETTSGSMIIPPIRSATGSYYPEDISSSTTAPNQETLEIPIESKAYGSGKPRRIVIRGKIIRDQDQS